MWFSIKGEIYIQNQRITQLEESNVYYKNESDTNYRKTRECDQSMADLAAELNNQQCMNEDSVAKLTEVARELKASEGEKVKLQETKKDQGIEIEELKKKIGSLTTRYIDACYVLMYNFRFPQKASCEWERSFICNDIWRNRKKIPYSGHHYLKVRKYMWKKTMQNQIAQLKFALIPSKLKHIF